MGEGVTLTERELDVMSVLWRHGSGTVAEVREELGGSVGYTGVLKLLQILEEKELVEHTQEGRAYRYLPLVEPSEAGGPALRRIVDKVFHGSAELAFARLISGRKLSPDEVERMKAMLDAAEREGRQKP
jgi:predicted transcriptional regulator